MNLKDSFSIFLRYLILVAIALPGISVFYLIFTPLTTYPSFWLLNLLHKEVIFFDSSFTIGDVLITLIPACIAGSAYYLLLILNMATPMKLGTRIKSILFLFASFLLFNIIRIVLFTSLFLAGFSYFDVAHKSVWYFGSTILVVLIWFLNIKIFKIKAIPAYTDLIKFYKESKKK